jgi:hypothetical protein
VIAMTVTGSTEAILAGMFRQHDAHVVAFWRWRFLFNHGICDRAGVILVGRRIGQRVRMP